MPGTPATSPRVGAPRFSQSDAAIFADDVNGVVDAFDAAVALEGDLIAEVTRAEAAESGEVTARAAADSSEATTRAAADTALSTARANGDNFEFVHVAAYDSNTSPPAAGTVIGIVPVPVKSGQPMTLIAAVICCTTASSSKFKVQTDHGHSDGSLADVTLATGSGQLVPATGRFQEVLVYNAGVATPLALNRYDKVAVTVVTQGASLGCSIALLFGRSAT